MSGTRQQNNSRRGSAMILVVVVTVLLAVVGVMFVMVARLGEMETSAVIDSRDLDAAVDTVVAHIHSVLVEDLFEPDGTIGKDGPDYTWPGPDPRTGNRCCPWLAVLEPNSDNDFQWDYISDLSEPGSWPPFDSRNLPPQIITPGQTYGSDTIQGFPADADGDGVADSRWIQVPNLTTSRAEPVFAAIRIIDNCSMLNLNTAFGFYQMPSGIDSRPWHSKPWYRYISPTNPSGTNDPYHTADFGNELGRYLSEVNAAPLLRAYDRSRVERLHRARDSQLLLTAPDDFHNQLVMSIESPESQFLLFGIDDELEIRNRYLLTSSAIARFEKRHLDTESRDAVPPAPYSGTLYYTFDYGRGTFDYDQAGYGKSRVPRTPFTEGELVQWRDKLDPLYFDWNPDSDSLDDFIYDRRHITTFYSFDRPLRTGRYPLLDAALAAEYSGLIDAGYSPLEARQRLRDIESVFRPLDFRPIDLRHITDPANPDRITANTPGARGHLLHLLYAYRAYFLPSDVDQQEPDDQPEALQQAAFKAAQAAANLIDYLDDDNPAAQGPFYAARFGAQDNPDPTFITEAIINEMLDEAGLDIALYPELAFGLDPDDIVYGYERQPFLSEIYCQYDGSVPGGAVRAFAIELLNPYDEPIRLDGWRFQFGSLPIPLDGQEYEVPARSGDEPGRLTIWRSQSIAMYPVQVTGDNVMYPSPEFLSLMRNQNLTLQRPDPRNEDEYISVDRFRGNQLTQLFSDTYHSAKRDDTQWRFTNSEIAQEIWFSTPWEATLGQNNDIEGIFPQRKGYQLPVADDETPTDRLADFLKTMWVSNQKEGDNPQPITKQIADAQDESDIRLDIQTAPGLLDYLCFLNRPEKGTLPGRININTAAKHVIAAAIAPQLVMADPDDEQNALVLAEQIVANRPYRRVSELLGMDAFRKFAEIEPEDITLGDPMIHGDFEQRDWIVSRLANIFTVRSDVFTAYILVRLGPNGPERRMIAIFDRSQVVSPDDRPTLVALHPVPDPR